MHQIVAEHGFGKNTLADKMIWSTLMDRIQALSITGCIVPDEAYEQAKKSANCSIIPLTKNEINKCHLFTRCRNSSKRVCFKSLPLKGLLELTEGITELTYEEFLKLKHSDGYICRQANAIKTSSMVDPVFKTKTKYYRIHDVGIRFSYERDCIFAINIEDDFAYIVFAAALPNIEGKGTFEFDGFPGILYEGMLDQAHHFVSYKVDLSENASSVSKLYRKCEDAFLDIITDNVASLEEAEGFDKSNMLEFCMKDGAEKYINPDQMTTFVTLRRTLLTFSSEEKMLRNVQDITLSDEKFVFFRDGVALTYSGKVFDFCFAHRTPVLYDSTLAVQWNPERNPGPKGRDISLIPLYVKSTFNSSIWLRPKNKDNAEIDIFAGIDIGQISSGQMFVSTVRVNGDDHFGDHMYVTSRVTFRNTKHVLMLKAKIDGTEFRISGFMLTALKVRSLYSTSYDAFCLITNVETFESRIEMVRVTLEYEDKAQPMPEIITNELHPPRFEKMAYLLENYADGVNDENLDSFDFEDRFIKVSMQETYTLAEEVL